MQLRYGSGTIDFEISEKHFCGILESEKEKPASVEDLLKKAVTEPINAPRLGKLLRKNRPTDLVIIVSDISRSIANYKKILKFLVGEIVDAGVDEKNIHFIIAIGTHRTHTPEENKKLFGELFDEFEFIFHNCNKDLVTIGKTSTDLSIEVNKRARDADFVLLSGRVDFHYLAGFSGGRKSILPGISSYDTIRTNHSKLRREGVAPGELKNNIIAQEMAEALELFKPDYLVNVVETTERETSRIFFGNPVSAFEQAVEYFCSRRNQSINQLGDCVLVSAGGYPQDNNFYNSHKSLNLAIHSIKPGGSVILVARCQDGMGNEKFLKLMQEHNIDQLLNYPEEKIEIGGHRAFVTAKILKQYKVYVLSEISPKILKSIGFIPINKIEEGIENIKKETGDNFKLYIIPNGKTVLPVLKNQRRQL